MEFSQVIRETYNQYLLWLDDGNEPIDLPKTEAFHRPDYVHAGALMDCPLKAFKERSKAKPVLPALAKRNNPTLLHRMLQGTRCAEPFQEAFTWYKDPSNYYFRANTEVNVIDDSLKLQGRVDLKVTLDRSGYDSHIVEFKHRLPTWKDKFPQPRMGDVFQLLAYMKIEQAKEGHLVIINTPQYADFFDETKGYMIWTLHKDSEYSDGYVLQDENMDAWQHNLNHGGYINQTVLEDEILRQLEYINGETNPPISLDEEERWQCLKITRYAKPEGIGIFHKQCPYWCHDDNLNENAPYTLNSDGEFIIMEIDQ